MQRTREYIYITLVILIFSVFFSSCVSPSSIADAQVEEILVEGSAYIEEGLYEQAEDVFIRALLQFPFSARLHYNLGVVYALQGDFSQSLNIFQSLNELTGMSNVKYVKALGGVAKANNSFENAIEAWEQVVILDPLDTDTRLKLIQLLIDSMHYDKAYAQAFTAYSLEQYSKQVFMYLSSLEVLTNQGDGISWALISDSY